MCNTCAPHTTGESGFAPTSDHGRARRASPLQSRLWRELLTLNEMKNLLLPLLLLLFLCSQPVRAQNPDTLRAIYSAYVGVRELTRHNDGPEVERFLAHVGLQKGAPWCAAFVSYCLHKAGYTDAPRSGWSPDYFPKEKRIWENTRTVVTSKLVTSNLFRSGDLFGIWYANLGRIAHVGFIDCPDPSTQNRAQQHEKPPNATTPRINIIPPSHSGAYITTVEGNTNDNGSREGIGVFRKYRPLKSIKYIARWTTPRSA